ncbi:MAG TPA: GNAT family N-acetyltransferase [Candidatus Dormibacteraeota bacterium]
MTSERVRRLDPGDAAAAAALLDVDVVRNAFLRSELRLGALRSGVWWGIETGGSLRSVLACGALAVPWLGAMDDAPMLARVVDRQRQPQLMTGPREHVLAIHRAQRPAPRPREVRDPQPLLVVQRGALRRAPASGLRRGTLADLDRLTAASAAMHREEMGVDPLAVDPTGWRQRMATLIERGWSYVLEEGGQVIFKAELSAWTPEASLVQGVYTIPQRRGQGVGTAAMAALCEVLLSEAPLCTLYVNHFNTAARRLYVTLGFEHVGDFATLFF